MPLLPQFTPAFWADATAPDDLTSADRAAPGASRATTGTHGDAPPPRVRYLPERHVTVERFALSEDFAPFSAQTSEVLAQLRQFAAEHSTRVHATAIDTALRVFEQRLLTLDPDGSGHNVWFGSQAQALYGTGKELLDRIGLAMSAPLLPLATRLDALQALTQELDICGDGILHYLVVCTQALSSPRDGLGRTARLVSDSLIQDVLTRQVDAHLGDVLAAAPGDQLHYVTGLQQVFYPALGRAAPEDRLAKVPSAALVRACELELEKVHRPATLALALADRALTQFIEDLAQRLALPVETLRRGFLWNDAMQPALDAAQQGLVPAFGTVSLAALIDWRDGESGDARVRVHNHPMPLAVMLLEALERLGVVTEAFAGRVDIALAPDVSGPHAPRLSILDVRWAWVHEHGVERALALNDLRRAMAVGHAYRSSSDAPETNSATAEAQAAIPAPGGRHRADLRPLLSVLAPIVLQSCWPEELTQLGPGWVISADTAAMLARPLDDVALQRWLEASHRQLNPRQIHWLLEVLVTQGREALLTVEALTRWRPLTPSSLPDPLLRLSADIGADVLSRMVDITVHVAFQLSPAEAGRWLLPRLQAPAPGQEPLLMRGLMRAVANGRTVLRLMMTAHARAWLSVDQCVQLLSGRRPGLHCSLAARLCGFATPYALQTFLQIVEEAREALSLSGESLCAILQDDAAPPMHRPGGPTFAFWRADVEAPMITMHRLLAWRRQGWIDGPQFHRLMTMPTMVADAPYSPVAVRLIHVAPLATGHFCHVIGTALREGLITKAQFRSMALARQREDVESSSLLHHILNPFSASPVDAAAQRLASFLGMLVDLATARVLTRDDLIDLLLQPEHRLPPAWPPVLAHNASSPLHQCATLHLRQLMAVGGLTEADIATLCSPLRLGVATPDEVD